ncbi:MAG TPA: acyl-CoA reductase [Prolixibacteraceae bacterium]
MQKSEAAVIPMQKNFNDIEFLFPREFDIDSFIQSSPLEPFSEDSMEYLNALSIELNKSPNIRNYPDVATFAFFCRKANIHHLKTQYSQEDILRLGRGIVFHIAPSNVPVNFAYSLICGLLSGNLNIVRVPSKRFEQVEIICNAIQKLSQESKFESFSSRIVLLRYDRQNSATAYLSSICDVRVIWGGDTTIEQIRANKLPPRSFDITFADRYSLCAINADKYIHETAPEKIALGFYNDTYLFDQNACTAPHLIIWLGNVENIKIAQKNFWDNLYELVKSRYQVQPVIAVDKLTSFYNQAALSNQIKKTNTPDNLIWRIELNDLSKDIDKFRCTSGYFSEYKATSLFELSKIIDRKYQTLSYYGIEKGDLIQFIEQVKPLGIDRIVPIGKTTDFSLTWDGFNLIESLSRRIDIE